MWHTYKHIPCLESCVQSYFSKLWGMGDPYSRSEIAREILDAHSLKWTKRSKI